MWCSKCKVHIPEELILHSDDGKTHYHTFNFKHSNQTYILVHRLTTLGLVKSANVA